MAGRKPAEPRRFHHAEYFGAAGAYSSSGDQGLGLKTASAEKLFSFSLLSLSYFIIILYFLVNEKLCERLLMEML